MVISYRESRKILGGDAWLDYRKDEAYWNSSLRRAVNSDDLEEVRELIDEGKSAGYKLYTNLEGVRSKEVDTFVREYPY